MARCLRSIDSLATGFWKACIKKLFIHELYLAGLKVASEVPLQMEYKNQVVGEFRADIVVESNVLIELKATSTLHPSAEAQVINYLKATGIKVGLLVNFTWPKATIKRLVF